MRQNCNLLGRSQRGKRSQEKKTRIRHPNRQDQRTTRTHHVLPDKTLKSPRLRFEEKVDERAYTIEDPPNRYKEDFLTECNEEQTQDWQRRWNVGMILRNNTRHPDDPKPLLQWITESPDNYATLK